MFKKCFWCEREFKKLTKDHVIPKADGGNRIRYNIVMACKECNSERGQLASIHGQIRVARLNFERLTQEQINILHRTRINLVRIREKWIKIEKEKRQGHSASEELEFDPPGLLMEFIKPRPLSSKKRGKGRKPGSSLPYSVLREARSAAEDRFNQVQPENDMTRRDEQLAKLKPIPCEKKYADYDEDTGLYCVFGLDSGFAYSSWASQTDAEKHVND